MVKKFYKGVFLKKYSKNEHFIVTMDSKIGNGIIFHIIGEYNLDNKKYTVLWTSGFYNVPSDIIVDDLLKSSNDWVLLDKVPSIGKTEDFNIDFISIKEWKSPMRIIIEIKKPGNYLKTNIDMIFYERESSNSFIFIADMNMKKELENITSKQIPMMANKAKVMFSTTTGKNLSFKSKGIIK